MWASNLLIANWIISSAVTLSLHPWQAQVTVSSLKENTHMHNASLWHPQMSLSVICWLLPGAVVTLNSKHFTVSWPQFQIVPRIRCPSMPFRKNWAITVAGTTTRRTSITGLTGLMFHRYLAFATTGWCFLEDIWPCLAVASVSSTHETVSKLYSSS